MDETKGSTVTLRGEGHWKVCQGKCFAPHCGDQKDTEKFSVAIPFITHIHNDEVIGQ